MKAIFKVNCTDNVKITFDRQTRVFINSALFHLISINTRPMCLSKNAFQKTMLQVKLLNTAQLAIESKTGKPSDTGKALLDPLQCPVRVGPLLVSTVVRQGGFRSCFIHQYIMSEILRSLEAVH